RASFLLDYFQDANHRAWLSETMMKGSGPPLTSATGNSDSLLGRLETWFTDVKDGIANLTPASIWNGIQVAWDNTSSFLGTVGTMLVEDPVGLVSTVAGGVRDGAT